MQSLGPTTDLKSESAFEGVPVVAQWVTNLTSICKDTGFIPGLAQWVKDLVLLQAVMQVADVAWILRCCGRGIGQQLQL